MLVNRHRHAAKCIYLSKRLLIMSDRNFSRRRRGGMRFRPSGGLGHGQQQRPDRDATQARAEAVGGPPAQEKVFDQRHTHEIERDENIAAGLPPEGVPAESTDKSADTKRDYREPNLQTPPQVKAEEKFPPLHVKDQPHD